jgi:IS1 family transposase
MNILSRDRQIQIIGCLTEGMSIRATERMTGIHRDTIMRLGAKVGRGCAELHDRMMVGLRVGRIECDELWAYVAKKQKHLKRTDGPEKGDQYTFVALRSSSRAIIAYRTGKRDMHSTSYVERSNLSIRMANRRFTRLTNGFSKTLANHAAAVSLYVAHYNLCRVHETLRSTPAVAIGITDHAWSLGEMIWRPIFGLAQSCCSAKMARAQLHG